MNGSKTREIKKIVRAMFKEVVDPLELKRIMRIAKKKFNASKGLKS